MAVPGVRWDLAADALASLMAADVVERALILRVAPLRADRRAADPAP